MCFLKNEYIFLNAINIINYLKLSIYISFSKICVILRRYICNFGMISEQRTDQKHLEISNIKI